MVSAFQLVALTVISWVAAKPTDFQKRTRIKRTSEGNIEEIQFTFDCSNKAVGFYADVEYDCQIFHMCGAKGKRIPHVCANDTSFNQEFRICDWEYNFKCSDAPKWYYLNELTYATEPLDEEG